MLIEIKHRWNKSVLFSHDQEENSLKITLEMAVKADVNLAGANLAGANLTKANLAGANLADANLAGANLADTNLAGANLVGANLADANLAGANLADANLAGAYLAGVNLTNADLEGAYLAGAYLVGTYLAGVNLIRAKIEGEAITIQPIQISGLAWHVLITDEYLRIGCQRHTHERWFEFSDELIAKMDLRAAEFWEMWKVPLMIMCVKHAKKCKEHLHG